MDSQGTPDRLNFRDHLLGLVKAGAGGIVIASATVASAPAAAAPATDRTADRPAILERVEGLRRQAAANGPSTDAATAEGPLLAWGNWHNWRNGWPNGWHNWRNWGNYS